MSSHILHPSDSTFQDEVVASKIPVLLDFWADWCGPCKAIGPLLEAVASERSGTLAVAKMNVDDNPETPSRHGVRGIPTLILYKDGQIRATHVGALTKAQLNAFLDENL